MLVGHPAIANPYSWTNLENQLYCSIVRLSYNMGCFMIMMPMFLGHFNFGKYLMSTSLMRAVGKLSFLVALILPLAIGLLYNTQQDSVFMSLYVVMFLGLGNMACMIWWSFVSRILFEHPIKTLISVSGLQKALSHDDILHEHFMKSTPAPSTPKTK